MKKLIATLTLAALAALACGPGSTGRPSPGGNGPGPATAGPLDESQRPGNTYNAASNQPVETTAP